MQHVSVTLVSLGLIAQLSSAKTIAQALACVRPASVFAPLVHTTTQTVLSSLARMSAQEMEFAHKENASAMMTSWAAIAQRSFAPTCALETATVLEVCVIANQDLLASIAQQVHALTIAMTTASAWVAGASVSQVTSQGHSKIVLSSTVTFV